MLGHNYPTGVFLITGVARINSKVEQNMQNPRNEIENESSLDNDFWNDPVIKNLSLKEQFFYAVMLGDYERIQFALERGIAVDTPCFNHGATALIVMTANEKIVRLLLAWGANVNAQDWEGISPLINAISCQQKGVVKLLLEHGADPLLPHHSQPTPLVEAEEGADIEILSLLRQATLDR